MKFGKPMNRSNIVKANAERKLAICREMAIEMMCRASDEIRPIYNTTK